MQRKSFYLASLMVLVLMLAACGAPAADAPADTAGSDSASADAAPTEAPAEEAEAEPMEAPAEEEEPAADEDSGDEAASAESQAFAIVPGESTASYVVQEEFFADALSKFGIEAGDYEIVGTTSEVEGTLVVDLETASLLEATINVNLPSLTTEQDRRDNWVREREPQFNTYPVATFTAIGASGAPTSYTEGEEVSFQLLGDLVVRETARPTTFDVTAKVEGGVLTGTATSEPMLLTDFGINPPNFAGTLSVGEEFVVRVNVTAQAQ